MKIALYTSCISTFIRIKRIDLLLGILSDYEITITEQVFQELKASKLENVKNFSHSKIRVEIASIEFSGKYGLHAGEASILSFAKKNDAIAIVDDKKARNAAEKEKISFFGTAALIRIGIEKNLIKKSEAKQILEDITVKAELFISEDVKKLILD